MLQLFEIVLIKNSLLTAFAFIGLITYISYLISDKLLYGLLHSSVVAISIGLILAYVGGVYSEGSKGLADIPLLSGLGIMGGAMLRDFAIVATAFGVRMEELRKGGILGVASLFIGIFSSFMIGITVAFAFGYRDAVSLTTLGAGAATYIVGPVTGTALGATSEVIALSIATGLVKAILVMITTPLVAKYIGLNNPRAAMIFGGVMGTNSGVMAGLAATNPKLVPYGAMTATFYTGLGCLLGPSLIFILVRALF